MAPISALLLVTALVAALAAGTAGAGALLGLGRPSAQGARRALGRAADALVGLAGSVPLLRRSLDRRRAARRDLLYREQMPDALRLLCVALDAGSSLVKALEYAAENAEEPLAQELRRTVWDLQVGQGFDEAMAHLRERTGGAEFAYLAVAMEVQHRSGGSLADVLGTISASLRGSAELAESLRTQTAQGRLSARIVAAMPVAILGAFSMFAPSYLAMFVSGPLGIALLALAIALELCGVAWVRRSLSLDLSSHLGGDAL